MIDETQIKINKNHRERIEKLEFILFPKNQSAKEDHPCNDCKVEQWIKEDPEEWIAYEFCGKRCKYGSPFKPKKEDKPTNELTAEELGRSCMKCNFQEDLYICNHKPNPCTDLKHEFFKPKEKPKDSEDTIKEITHELNELYKINANNVKEIERLKSWQHEARKIAIAHTDEIDRLKSELEKCNQANQIWWTEEERKLSNIIEKALEYLKSNISINIPFYEFYEKMKEILEGKI